jgi:TonB family protein
MTHLAGLGPKLNGCVAIDAGPVAVVPGGVDLRAELTIAPDGQVTTAKITSSNGNEAAASCVRAVLEKERFAPPTIGQQVVVNVPIRLPMRSAR